MKFIGYGKTRFHSIGQVQRSILENGLVPIIPEFRANNWKKDSPKKIPGRDINSGFTIEL
jgi:hypothetical protein